MLHEAPDELAGLLERFRRGPELLAVVLTGAAGEELDFTPAAGKWSVRQLMAHLADSELIGAHRFRQIIAEDNPTLIGVDQDAWASNLDYARRTPKQSLESFRRVRGENYELLRELPEATYDRVGRHTERGPLSLRVLLENYADHAESHAKQLQSLRDAYKKAKTEKKSGTS